MSSTNSDWGEEKPLAKVGCRDHACEKDLHTFLRNMQKSENRGLSYRSENCTACGSEINDWPRLDRHDLRDVNYTIEALQHEYVRHRYWDTKINLWAVNYALRKGLSGLRVATERRLWKSVGPLRKDNYMDGRQTPKEGNIINYAQHATATCCRPCIEAWHMIDRNGSIIDADHAFMTELIMEYIRRKMPYLGEFGQYVPQIRKIKASSE